MTFDEARVRLKALSNKGADTWYGDSLNKHTNVKGHIEAGDIETIIYKLQEEYAPTIEMTKEDKNTLGYYLENSTFFSLIERKHAGIEVEMLGIIAGSNEFLNLSDEDLMQAWLHPETIKVIDL